MVSNRKPGGQVLRQLSHQDCLQISEAAACAASPEGLALAEGCRVYPVPAWLSGTLFLKQS